MSAKERSSVLRRWHDLILENAEDLASLMTWEQGKPLAESLAEIKYGAGFIEYYAEEAKRVLEPQSRPLHQSADCKPTNKPSELSVQSRPGIFLMP